MKKKGNNKGFSLVELIVVIAIMAILAVTLAPRLTHYIEKARLASDQEVVNTIYNATKLSFADDTLLNGFTAAPTTGTTSGGTTTYPYTLSLRNTATTANTYVVTNKAWKISDIADANLSAFLKEMKKVVGDFTLKASKAGDNTIISITLDANNKLTVTLDYNGSTYADGDGYQVTE